MSSVNVYFGGNFAIWGTDGAAQLEIDGQMYRYTDDRNKIFIAGDTIVAMVGKMNLFNAIEQEFIQCPVKTPETLQQIAKRFTSGYPVPPKVDGQDTYGIADILLGRFENGQFALYHLCQDNGFSISRCTAKPGGTSFISMGIKTGETNKKFLELLKNYGNQPNEPQITEAFMQTYNYVSSQEIGGMMRLYLQIPEYMGQVFEYPIKEVLGVKRYPQDCPVSLDRIQSVFSNGNVHCVYANKIIASDICALSSDDGYTKLVSGGVKVLDGSGVVKAYLGQYENGKFGLMATNGYIEGAKSKWDLGTGTFRLGNSDSDFKMKFDGTSLTFSNDVRIQFKGDTGPQGAQGPQGPAGVDGSYYAPKWVDATEIRLDLVASPRIVAGNAYLHDALIVGADGNNYAGISGVGTSADSVRFWAGNSDRNQAPFRVTQAGKLFATNASIYGNFYTYDENNNLVGKFTTEGAGDGAAAYLLLKNTKTGFDAFTVYADLSNGGNQTIVDSTFSVKHIINSSGNSDEGFQFRSSGGQINWNGIWVNSPLMYAWKKVGETTEYHFRYSKQTVNFITQKVGFGGDFNPLYPLHVEGQTKLNGNVGIGKNPTSYALDVQGNVLINGDLGVNGNVALTGTLSGDISANNGVSGTFKSSDSPAKTITVTNGIITGIA